MNANRGHFRLTRRSVLGVAMLPACAWLPAQAQPAGLVIDGEEIATAELLEAARAEGSLLSYTVNFETLERNLLDRFSADTGISCDLIRLPTARMHERVVSEAAAGRLQADIITLTDKQLMTDFVGKKILAPHKVPAWEDVPAPLKERDGHYYAMNSYVSVLGYNKGVWEPEQAPKAWADLLDPKLDGHIGIVQASAGGGAWLTALFQRRVIASDYWTRLARNKPRIYTSLAPLSDDLARGEVTVAVSTPGLIRGLLEAGAPVGLNFPAEGSPAVSTLGGVSASAEHPNSAKLFLNWVTSRHGGAAVSEIFLDYPANALSPVPKMAEHGIALASTDKLWYPSEEDVLLRDKWIPEWDSVFRGT